MGRLTEQQLQYIIQKHNHSPCLLIETGTCEGGFTLVASKVFPNVISIELNEVYYNMAKGNCKDIENIKLIHGNSVDELASLVKKYKKAAMFYLDAHYFNNNNAEVPLIPKSKFPLWDELKIITKRKAADIIIVDDVHTFERERPELRYEGEADWETVSTTTILSAIGLYKDCEIIGDAFVIWR